MKRAWLAIILGALIGCSSSAGDGTDDPSDVLGDGPILGDGEVPGDPPTGSGSSSGMGSSTSSSSTSSSGSGGAGSGGSGSGGSGTVEPGTLTAGAWDDNLNYSFFLDYRADVLALSLPGMLSIGEVEHGAANAVPAPGAKTTLDVSLVIDTTGSMGDEIAYLQTEFDALAATIESLYPASQQRWSLVVYRDTTDDYVVRWFNFRDNTAEFRDKLGAQSASGGGDYPEAADLALDVAYRLAWRTDPHTARLMFWVADAPHHAEKAGALTTAIRGARDAGIHIYPVASSGIDEMTEHSMRSAAQLTNGRYLFLTDDSGVGGEHKEPTIPCYYVTKLDDAILRMVDIELSGQYVEPAPEDVIRTGGDPDSGVCELTEGGTVLAF